ncbi:PglL family O-oligosaccharyltransferase [Paludibacterium yongneupense]|uniref:PglL family O-oligosaccharyltransferase n=1 Tax=Paludibacterium yongneupense TaxID=400061 RepID=UPI00041F1F83|nr:O-antigen ligase family protein [Paludibacterium yongneupense]
MQLKSLLLGVATLLWCLIAILPFASRIHYVPLPQWWGEMLVVWLTLGAGVLLTVHGTLFERLPRAALWCMLMAVCWAVHPLLVPTLFPGMNDATALAWGALAVLACVTVALRDEVGTVRLTVLLAYALIAGALVQTAIGFTQLSGLAQHMSGLVFYDSEHPTTNIFGHIGQRNQYAHYLMWGLIGGVYLHATGRLGRIGFALLTLWLALMVGWAGSRTTLLYVLAIAALGVLWHLRLRNEVSRRLMLAMLFACGLVVAVQFLLPVINHLLGVGVASGMQRLAANGDDMGARRFAEMHKAWLVFRAHPLFGVGWSQFAKQSVDLQQLPQFAGDGFNSGLFTNAHNLILQLLAEMGGVVTAIVLLGFVWCILPFFTRSAEAEGLLAVACIAVTSIHSMLEYPLWYLYFLGMLVVFCALAPAQGIRSVLLVRVPALAAMLALLGLSVQAIGHYNELVGLYTPLDNPKQDAKRMARLSEIVDHEPLYAFHALYTLDNYLEAAPDTLPEKRRWIYLLAAIRPYPDVLLKKAEFEAGDKHPQQALASLRLALASFPTYAGEFMEQLDDDNHPEWAPLRKECKAAYNRLPPAMRTRGDLD